MTSPPPIVIPTGSPPAGTPFSQRESAGHRLLLEANGYGGATGVRQALRADDATLRAAAYQLVADASTPDDASIFEQGLRDPDGAVRAWAALGLDRLRPGAGRPVLRQLAADKLTFGDYAPLIAADALARLGDPAGLPTLARADALDEPLAVLQRVFWFARLGCAEVWPRYERALAGGDAARELALLQLRELATPDAVRVIERFVTAHPADAEDTASARAVLAELQP